MEDDFNYKAVPYHFLHCLNRDCLSGENCLHRLAALHIPSNITAVMALNPTNYPKDTAHCPYFKSIEKVRYAWGHKCSIRQRSFQKGVVTKKEIRKLYPKATYYRIFHCERALSPNEQDTIASLFKQCGVLDTPVFDFYTEEYNWSEQENPKPKLSS